MRWLLPVVLAAGVVLTACGGTGRNRGPRFDANRMPATVNLLLRYDADKDGSVSEAEMQAGLAADFSAADLNGDRLLQPNEVAAENERRWQRDGVESSPLRDWNLDGAVDMAEFTNTTRSYFGLLDRDKNGRVAAEEFRGPSAPIPPRPEQRNRQRDDDEGENGNRR